MQSIKECIDTTFKIYFYTQVYITPIKLKYMHLGAGEGMTLPISIMFYNFSNRDCEYHECVITLTLLSNHDIKHTVS